MLRVHRSIQVLLAAAALTVSAMPAAAASLVGPLSGVGTGSVASGGVLQPVGDGRFRVTGREYQVRMSADEASGCFRGSLRVSEEAVLSVPHYAGAHEGTMEIASDAGTLLLRYRGDVNRYVGKGDWWVVRGTASCADVSGTGDYMSSFSSGQATEYRLELHGRVVQGD
jgi:hypothetical protein